MTTRVVSLRAKSRYMKASIGIDIGTSAVKVVALGRDGYGVLAETTRAYPMATPRPGWVEQSPEDWWRATCEALAELYQALPGIEIVAVGLSGQVNGLVLLDKQDRLLGNAIIWLDARAEAQAERLKKQHRDILTDKAATDINAISVLAKLAWLSDNDPERLRKAGSLLFVKDYILWRLTGQKCTDASEVTSAGMLDIKTNNWLDGVAAMAGFDPALLPPIQPSTRIVDAITDGAARETGLPLDTPVVPGAGDVAALAVGCGATTPGILGITLGTAGHVVLSAGSAQPFITGQGLWRVAHAIPSQAVWLGLVMSGGLSLTWLHRTMTGAGSNLIFENFAALAQESEPGSAGVSFVPFLEGSATPYAQPTARGSFIGLSSSTQACHLVQAVMEGVAFNIRQCVDIFDTLGAEVVEIRMAEGGARVDRWCQIMADVLQRPVTRLGYLNTSSLGAALMAEAGLSGNDIAELSASLHGNGTRFEPALENATTYTQAYSRYRAGAEAEISRVATALRR